MLAAAHQPLYTAAPSERRGGVRILLQKSKKHMKVFSTAIVCLLYISACVINGITVQAARSGPPAYMRELSRLVAATASDSDFGRITLTVGEPEMEVDGETQPISEEEYVAPFIDEEGEVQIPVGVIEEADLNGSGFLSEEELEEQGYDVQMNDTTGEITITEPYQQCRLIVKTANGKVKNTYGATHVIRVSNNKTVLQYADKFAAKRAAEAFETEADVLFCAPDSICTICASSAAAEYTCWGTEVAGADQFMASLPDDLPQVTVAVIDTGVDMDHPFLEGRLLDNGWDFVQDDDDPDDAHDHGTHCAGIVRDATPDNVKILPVRVLDINGAGQMSVVIEGMTYAADSGADILSMSLGGWNDQDKDVFSDAVQYALEKGAAVFAAAGNDGARLDEHPEYPASCPGVITVAASAQTDCPASFSNYGSKIDVAAPGSNIVSSVRGGKYAAMSGTSMACPLAAACGALLKSEDVSRTPEDLRAELRSRARDAYTPGRDEHTGSGIVYLGADRPVEKLYCTQSELTLEPLADAGRAIEVVFEPAHPSDCTLSFQSSDPNVVLVTQTGNVNAVSAGTAVITVSHLRSGFSAQIAVTVTGDGKLRFKQIEGGTGMRFLQADGTAWAHGYGAYHYGYYQASARSMPFKMCSGPQEPITNIARFLTNSFFVKTDGSLWLIGSNGGWRSYRAPIPLMIDAQTPMTDVVDAHGWTVLRADGSLWYLPEDGEPYLVPVCTEDGVPVIGIARFADSEKRETGLDFNVIAEDGCAYHVWRNSRTKTVSADLITDPSGTPYTDVRDVYVRGNRESLIFRNEENQKYYKYYYKITQQIVLHEDGTLTNAEDNVFLQDVRSIGGFRNSNSGILWDCFVLMDDGSVWTANYDTSILAMYPPCPVETADGDPLCDVVLLQSVIDYGSTELFALRADGTVWAWGNNGLQRGGEGEVEGWGGLGVGWPDRGRLGSTDGVTYVYELMGGAPSTNNLTWHRAARQVKVDEETALTDVTDIDIQGSTNFFIRSDGSVYASGINDFSGYGASLVHGAVFARPFTVLGQQVYLDETASPTPYTTERVQTITVSKPDMAATVGETFTLTASVFPQDTYERNIYWKSSDRSVATVDGAGNVTTHGVGTAVIRAYSTTNDRVWGTCLLTVEEEAPVSVTMRQYPAKREYTTADVFDPTDGLLTLRYPNGQVRSIRISPDFCSGCDMTQTGEQTVTIRYAGSTFSYSVTVQEADEAPPQNTQTQSAAAQTVSAYAEHILIWNQKPSKYLYARGEELDVSDGSFYVDTVVDNMPMTAEMCSGFDPMQVGAQTVTVTYTGPSYMDYPPEEFTGALTFDVFVTELMLENEVPEIEVGKCTRILATFQPRDVDGREIIWLSSDETIATVDEYGRVTGIAPGEVTITAQVKGSEAVASCTVTVLPRAAERIPGDADGDGAVDLKDIVQIARYLAGGWNAVIDLMNADVNCDGEVNLKDVVLLRRYLAGGWDIELY